MDDNREAATGAFNEHLNNEMSELFAQYASELISPEDKEKVFLSNSKIDELLDERAGATLRSLRMNILEGYMSGDIKALRQKKFGVSPIIFAHMVHAECYFQGLAPFFWNYDFWPENNKNSED